MRSLKGFTAAACLLALSTTAQAQVDDQTADEIRRGIKVWLGQTVMGMGDEGTVELDDQIAVTPAGDRYQVVLPAGRAILRGEGTLHFEPIEIDLTPTDNGWYRTSWQLPDSYRFEPTHGSDVLMTIGSQSIEGVVAPEFKVMISMDAALGDIEIRDSGEPSGMRVERITSTVRSTEVSAGVYDTTQQIAVSNISGYEDNRDIFTVETVTLDAVGNAVRLAEYAEFYDRLQSLAADPDAQVNTIAEYMGSMPMPYAGFEGVMTISGAEANDGGDRFSMAEWTTLIALTGLDGRSAEFVLDMGVNGVGTTVDELTDLVPNETRFRLAVVDLPNEELAKVLSEAFSGPGQVDPGMAMMMAAGNIQQAFSVAGTALDIGPIRLASSIASVDLEGALRPDLSSPYSVVGEIDMVATGLDALIVEIQRTGGDQEAVQFLTLLQTLGAQAPEADGRSVRTYAFRLDAGGTLLLNGSDIMPLITGMQ